MSDTRFVYELSTEEFLELVTRLSQIPLDDEDFERATNSRVCDLEDLINVCDLDAKEKTMLKKEFIEGLLNSAIYEAFDWTDHLEYMQKNHNEYVVIHCANTHTYKVKITFDSYGAIMEDVVKECLLH